MRNLFVFFLAAGFILLAGCGDDDDSPTDSRPLPLTNVIRVPGQVATIQQAIDTAQVGDTILVAEGVYEGEGNRDLEFDGKSVTLVSEEGPAVTIIDCGGDSANYHFGFSFIGRENEAVVDGFTVRGGYNNMGAAMLFQSTSPTVKNCILSGNHATVSGGAVRCKSASPTFINCTLAGNSTDMAGAGIFVIAGASPVLHDCMIVFSEIGEAVYSSDVTSIPVFECCNIYGNAGGDWTGRIADQADSAGNFSSDPEFCEGDGEYYLQPSSPCAPANNDCGVLVGALGIGCQ